MDIRRFGYGHRRPAGPDGTSGVQAAVIHSDARATVSELAFTRKAILEPHSSPNTTWFLVIEGGGFVLVGDETARVFAGQAVHWPAGVVHGASTDVSEMRAIVVELAGPDDHALRGVLEGVALPLPAGPVAKAEGALADDRSVVYDPAHGEPL
ncbi:MAG: Cupin [Chloroflexota bacterium]|nr:Cupin [Chloroflexota bacterium]